MNSIESLEAVGLTLPSPAYIFGVIIFSVIGYAAYRYGKKTSREVTKWLGVVLMLYPYAISSTWQLYVVGTALSVGLYFFRR